MTSPKPRTTATDPGSTQLRLLPGGSVRREWVLDERTRTVGRQGVAHAREILRQAQPPRPTDEFGPIDPVTKAS